MKQTLKTYYILGISLIAFFGCSKSDNNNNGNRFEQLSSKASGIDFVNTLTETDSLNYFTYPYIYMGGGVAVGDINNDGLADVFFTGNMVKNRLFLNKGDMKFEDISSKANVYGDNRWYTGAAMVDINADGFLDIYVSVAGQDGVKKNQLYINNGDLTFTERAAEYGLDDAGQSIQTTFFDYDHDGDLDVYVANYPTTSFKTPNSVYRFMMNKAELEKSNHLYRNDGENQFTDVTKISGVANFGLSISATVADYNNDGWEDIYVSNDFSTPDFLYMNNGDGTFSDKLKESTKQTSFYGMGSDAADFNNDGLIDLIQMDMAPEDNKRSKANMASMNPQLFWETVNAGFHYQYMYNSLQLNRGIGKDSLPIFSNVAWIAGVSSTDWSWAPLMADFDNDGWKDLFVSNGTRRDINNKDFFKKFDKSRRNMSEDSLGSSALSIPSEKVDNYIFRNTGGITFEKVNEQWGLSYDGFSNGAAYADFDNDGDLDLVINNIDEESVIFKNNTADFKETHYLRIKFAGLPNNPFGIGTKVTLVLDGKRQFSFLNPVRGFQSSVAPILHFGLGKETTVDSVIVAWLDGKRELLLNVKGDQLLTIRKGKNIPFEENEAVLNPIFTASNQLLDTTFLHQENFHDDYRRQVLLPHKLSNFGPALAVSDVNGDGLDDFYIGNGTGFSGVLYVQQPDGKFSKLDGDWQQDAEQEDLGAVFFDADGDGDDDLYVVSGGNTFPKNDEKFQDRLYINNEGVLTKSTGVLPEITGSGSRVIPNDFDGDGDIDLFVGGRLSPHNYPYAGRSYLLVNQMNNGSLKFIDKTEELALGLSDIGMVTDALWTDFDQNGTIDLVVVGEWMPITIFSQESGKFVNRTTDLGYADTRGWWFSIEGGDFDGDGDVDLVVGNLGLNYKYHATPEETFDIYVNDFDKNGTADIVLGYYNFGKQYPVRGRQCSSEQIPTVQLKFKNYESFSTATIDDIYGESGLEKGLHYQVPSFASIYLKNEGQGKFTAQELPVMAQLSPINDMIVRDFNDDGQLDLLIAGNLYASEVETPRSDAGMGLLMLGNGDGTFDPQSYEKSGINFHYDLKNMALINIAKGLGVIGANNQDGLQIFLKD